MKDIFRITHAYTHAGVFHADDVFSATLLRMLNKGISINRVNSVDDIEDNDTTLIFDIGGSEYDHHQLDKAVRPLIDGTHTDRSGVIHPIPYCSFGLLWRDYGHLLCPTEKAWKKVDRDLVLQIDAADNGCWKSTLSGAIGTFNPAWNETLSGASYFEKAAVFAMSVLDRYIQRANAEVEAESKLAAAPIVDNILVLDMYVPFENYAAEKMPGVLYAVFPSNRGGWAVRTIPDAPGSFTPRKGFPAEWLGRPVEELGMTFCHPGNFILTCTTKEQAIEVARIASAA